MIAAIAAGRAGSAIQAAIQSTQPFGTVAVPIAVPTVTQGDPVTRRRGGDAPRLVPASPVVRPISVPKTGTGTGTTTKTRTDSVPKTGTGTGTTTKTRTELPKIIGLPSGFPDVGLDMSVAEQTATQPKIRTEVSIPKPTPTPTPTLPSPARSIRSSGGGGRVTGAIFRLPNGKQLAPGLFPAVVSWAQGFVRYRLDLRTKKRTTARAERSGIPKQTFEVIQTTDIAPKRQRIDMGVVDVFVDGSGLWFVADQAAARRTRGLRPRGFGAR